MKCWWFPEEKYSIVDDYLDLVELLKETYWLNGKISLKDLWVLWLAVMWMVELPLFVVILGLTTWGMMLLGLLTLLPL